MCHVIFLWKHLPFFKEVRAYHSGHETSSRKKHLTIYQKFTLLCSAVYFTPIMISLNVTDEDLSTHWLSELPLRSDSFFVVVEPRFVNRFVKLHRLYSLYSVKFLIAVVQTFVCVCVCEQLRELNRSLSFSEHDFLL